MDMKRIIIKKIKLSNWKAQNTDVEFSPNGNLIVGDNGVGKSSIQKGWNWLLTGQSDANTIKNSNLFDNKVEQTPESPSASVSATIEIDGKEYTLERSAKSKFTRKRGTDQYEKASSDEYKTFIDMVEYTATDFDAWINTNICSTNLLSYCLHGDFFLVNCINDKKKMREFLRVVVGDIDDSELKGDYEGLLELLKEKPIEIVEQFEKQMSNNLKKRQDELPSLINQCESDISNYKANYDFDAIRTAISKKEQTIADIDSTMLGLSSSIKPFIEQRNAAIAEKNHRMDILASEKKKYEDAEDSMRAQFVAALESAKKRNAEIEKRNQDKKDQRNSVEIQLQSYQGRLNAIIKRDELLKSQLEEIKSKVFTDDKCTFCGQPLPADMLESAKKKFDEDKKTMYNAIVAEGRSNKADKDMCETKIDVLSEWLSNADTLEETESLQQYIDNIESFDKERIPFEQMEMYSILKADAESIVIPELPNNDNQSLIEEKKKALDELSELNKQLGIKVILETAENNLEKYKEEQRSIACQIAECENILIQIKNYRQEKAELTSKKVNEHLVYANIQMFSRQKDGTIIPDLIVKDKNGVAYSTTNGASRILMAVDMQRFFCDKCEINMPVFVDEASVINHSYIPDYLRENQLFLMYFENCPLTIKEL